MEQASTNWGYVPPREIKFVEKRWGYERWFVNNEKFCGKELFIASGRFTSFHWHEIKEEMLYVQKGVLGWIWSDEQVAGLCVFPTPMGKTLYLNNGHTRWRKIYPGAGFYVTPRIIHQLYAFEGDVTIIETSSQHFDEDSYRSTTELVHDFNYEDDGR